MRKELKELLKGENTGYRNGYEPSGTTNLVERGFEEERRRTKIIPYFLTEKCALKLVFSVLIRAAKKWRKVSFTKIELNCLDKLKEELGIREGFQNKQDKQELKGVC